MKNLTIRNKAILRVLSVCLLISSSIAGLKIAFGVHTNSLAFIADGIHSLFDSGATLIGMLSIFFSSQPPDRDHPYGHQKFETVAAMALSIMQLFAAFEVAKVAYHRLSSPFTLERHTDYAILVLAITMITNLFLARYEAKAAKKWKSSLLETDAIHNSSDFWVSVGVLVSVVCLSLGIPAADTVISFSIALYLFILAIQLSINNIRPLVDARVINPKEVEKIVNSVEGVLHCHNIRSRGEGNHYFLDLNIHLPGDMSLDEAHQITHEVEEELKKSFPGLIDVVIHTEPHNHPPCSKE